jgi:hypothetical protein
MKRLLLVCGLLASMPLAADAAPIYTCPGGNSECEGQTFALFATETADGWDISVSIDTTGYTGDESDLANGVEFKNVFATQDVLDLTLTDAPGGVALWDASAGQLSQDCAGADFADQGCAIWGDPSSGYDFFIGETLTWTFHIVTDDPLGDTTGHIKYRYVSDTGQPVAGLLSADIPICVNGDCEPVIPEPGTLMLLGSGLIFGARRLRQRVGR